MPSELARCSTAPVAPTTSTDTDVDINMHMQPRGGAVSVQSGVYTHTVTDERRAHLSVEKCPKAHNMCRQGARTCTGLVNRHSVPWQWCVNLPMHNRRSSHICSMATTQLMNDGALALPFTRFKLYLVAMNLDSRQRNSGNTASKLPCRQSHKGVHARSGSRPLVLTGCK